MLYFINSWKKLSHSSSSCKNQLLWITLVIKSFTNSACHSGFQHVPQNILEFRKGIWVRTFAYKSRSVFRTIVLIFIIWAVSLPTRETITKLLTVHAFHQRKCETFKDSKVKATKMKGSQFNSRYFCHVSSVVARI